MSACEEKKVSKFSNCPAWLIPNGAILSNSYSNWNRLVVGLCVNVSLGREMFPNLVTVLHG